MRRSRSSRERRIRREVRRGSGTHYSRSKRRKRKREALTDLLPLPPSSFRRLSTTSSFSSSFSSSSPAFSAILSSRNLKVSFAHLFRLPLTHPPHLLTLPPLSMLCLLSQKEDSKEGGGEPRRRPGDSGVKGLGKEKRACASTFLPHGRHVGSRTMAIWEEKKYLFLSRFSFMQN